MASAYSSSNWTEIAVLGHFASIWNRVSVAKVLTNAYSVPLPPEHGYKLRFVPASWNSGMAAAAWLGTSDVISAGWLLIVVESIPGVITVGDSREEVVSHPRAIEFHIGGLREEGLVIPAPSSFADIVEIESAA